MQQSPPASTVGTGFAVVGLFEFTIDDIGTDRMHTTVRRLDNAADRSALGTTPVTGITIANATHSGYAVIDGATFLHQSVEVTNATGDPVRGLTFVAYTGPWALDGTAFRVVDVGAPTGITPAIGTTPVAGTGNALYLDSFGVAALSTVVYTDTEIAALDAAVNGLSFVDAVLPYGFVARSAGDPVDRTIPVGAATGRLDLGFRIAHPDTNQVVWRAVAIIDDAVRVALPADYDQRTVDTGSGIVDNLATFADHAAALSQANDARVELVVLGALQAGDRFLLIDADDWRLGTARVVDLPWRVLPDVRIAGAAGPNARYWIGGAVASAAILPIDLAIEFKSTGPSYAFTPPPSTDQVEYLVVGGGGRGGTTTASLGYVAGGGGGGGGVVTGTQGITTVCTTMPCSVRVGAGGATVRAVGSALGGVSVGGGGAGGRSAVLDNTNGAIGGSGGGGGAIAGSGTAGQGSSGGVGATVDVVRVGSANLTVTTTSSDSSTFTLTSGEQACELLWVHFVFSAANRVVQPPTGWVLQSSGTHHAILTNSRQPGDPTEYTFAWTGGSTTSTRVRICLGGADAAFPLVSTDFTERTDEFATAPSVPSFRGALLISALSLAPSTSCTTPSGMGTLYSGGCPVEADTAAAGFRERRVSTSATGERTSNLGAERFSAFVNTVIRPGTSIGGGGGGGAPGQDGIDGGAGGDGVVSAITGTATHFGGGGGAGTMGTNTPPAGGIGGGGVGANRFTPAAAGAPHTGGGGGGGMTRDDTAQPFGNGGSGIVVVRFLVE